jgi:hypothetical protein
MKTLSFKDQNALFIGGRFGWVIDKNYVVGAGYYTLANTLDIKNPAIPGEGFSNLNYGGLEFEYYYFNSAPYHLSVSMLLGGGGVTVLVPFDNTGRKNTMTLNLLVYEPRICFEYSPLNWLNISTGVSYRVVTNLSGIYGVENKDLTGVTGSLSFRFGDYR